MQLTKHTFKLSGGIFLLALLFLLSLPVSLKAQLQFEQQLELTSWFEGWSSLEYYDAVELPDKSFAVYIGGYKVHPNNPNQINQVFSGLIFLDKYGEIILDQQTGLPKHYFFEIGLVNDGFVTNPETAGKNLLYLSDGTFVIYGMDMDRRFTVIRLDVNGNILFNKKMVPVTGLLCNNQPGQTPGDFTLTEVYDAVVLNRNKILFLCGSTYATVDPNNVQCNHYLSLLRIDKFGNFDNFYHEYRSLPDHYDDQVEGCRLKPSKYGGYIFSFATRSMSQIDVLSSRGLVEVKLDGSINWVAWNVPFKDWIELEDDHFVSVGFRNSHNQFNGTFTPYGQICEWKVIPAWQYVDEIAGAEVENAKFSSLVKKDDTYVCVGSYNWAPLLTAFPDDLSTYLTQYTYTFEDENAMLLDIKEQNDNAYLIGGFGTRFTSSPPSHGKLAYACNDPYLIRLPSDLEGWCTEGREIPFEEKYFNSYYSEGGEKLSADIDFESMETATLLESMEKDPLCCTESVSVTGDAYICMQGGLSVLSANYTPNGTERIYWTHDGKVVAGSDNQVSIEVSEAGDYFFFVELANGCLGQGHFTVHYYSSPAWGVPSLFSTRCLNDPAFNLYLVNEPVPGTWTGTGVTGSFPNYQFDPELAGPGLHTLHVHYEDQYGCEWDFDIDIPVVGQPVQAPAIPTSFCVYSGPYALPAGGDWVNFNNQTSMIQIIPSQYCVGCTLELVYCEFFNSGSTYCTICDPDTIVITFHDCTPGKRALGLEEAQPGDQLNASVYPNPASDGAEVILSQNSDYTLILRNMLGEEVQRARFSGSRYKIETEGLASGLYLLELQNARNESLVLKLTVEGKP